MARYLNDLDVNSSADGADVYLTEQSGVDKKITLNDIKDFVLESVFPIGTMYLQLPSMSDPSTLNYPGTWTNISSTYAGDFFRVEGGDASVYDAGQQTDNMQGHWHGALARTDRNVTSGGSDNVLMTSSTTTLTDKVQDAVTDGVNGEPRTGSETRPVNQTMRVWERTA